MYCTYDDLKHAISKTTLLQLCDDDNVGDIVVDPPNDAYDNLVAAVVKADNEINSYLAGRYTVPVTTVPLPGVINGISIDLSICELFNRRRDMEVPKGIVDRRKAALQLLKDIKEGIADVAELSGSRSSAYLTNKTENDRIFTDGVLEQF
jgi:phage gp36-like protein